VSFACVLARAQYGMESPLVRVEAHIGGGLPTFHVVGLPEAVVRESRERVRAALTVAGFAFPQARITVNLAPADFPKEGGRFDLPIALGILVASGQLPESAVAGVEFHGELSLGGELRAMRGALPAAYHATRAGHRVVLPGANAAEARLVANARVAAAWHLLDAAQHLSGAKPLEFATGTPPPARADVGPDLADVVGQAHARRALEVAAAGGHSMLMVGPPGAGKSMLAARLPGLLPPLDDAQALEVAALASLAGLEAQRGSTDAVARHWGRRPFRAPHHTASAIALVGGGGVPRPGEISLAHGGVLFLDELPEFDRKVLEVLREPLETGHVSISRAARQASFPARFQLVAAMNPCPCGWLGDPSRCRCTNGQVRAYAGRLSGPLLDRIDLQVDVPCVGYDGLRGRTTSESTATVAARVRVARERALARQGAPNAWLTTAQLVEHAPLDAAADQLLAQAASRFRLSARACHRVMKVARTIADLAGTDVLRTEHVAEALDCRRLERAGLQAGAA
jgi:magnesium chelatase family protein